MWGRVSPPSPNVGDPHLVLMGGAQGYSTLARWGTPPISQMGVPPISWMAYPSQSGPDGGTPAPPSAEWEYPPPPKYGQTDTCENSNFLVLHKRAVIKWFNCGKESSITSDARIGFLKEIHMERLITISTATIVLPANYKAMHHQYSL